MSARGQLDREPRHRLAVELGREEVARRSQLDAADVAQRPRRPVWVGALDDAFELLGLGEATLRRDPGVELRTLGERLVAELAARGLAVLFLPDRKSIRLNSH